MLSGAGPLYSSTAGGRSGLAGALSAVYSPGVVVLEARTSGGTQVFGDAVSDQSLLVGLRTRGESAFVMGTVGLGRARHSFSGDDTGWTDPSQSAITYELTAETNATYAGIGFSVFGSGGSRRTSYAALALSLQLGKLR